MGGEEGGRHMLMLMLLDEPLRPNHLLHPHTRTLARGKKMPPARAATDGMAGDSTASPSTRE